MEKSKKMSDKIVSICMPAYNAESYIEVAIQSIIQQDFDNWELIIVNDGSTDSTFDILSNYKFYPNIKIFSQENQGQSAAANRAFHESTGDYIKFFDADDVLSLNHLRIQVDAIGENENFIAASVIYRFYENDLTKTVKCGRQDFSVKNPNDWLLDNDGAGLSMMQCGMFLIPRNLIVKSGPWNSEINLINDFEFFPRLFHFAEKIIDTPKAIVYYRSGLGNSLSNSAGKKKLQSAFKALESTTKILLSNESTERCRKVLAVFWRIWAYQFYSDTKDLYLLSEKYIAQLGGAYRTYYHGKSGTLSKIIGWKQVNLLKNIIYKINIYYQK